MRPECDLLMVAVSFTFLGASLGQKYAATSPNADRSLKKLAQTSLLCQLHPKNSCSGVFTPRNLHGRMHCVKFNRRRSDVGSPRTVTVGRQLFCHLADIAVHPLPSALGPCNCCCSVQTTVAAGWQMRRRR